MGKKKNLTLRVRYKDDTGIKSRLVLTTSGKKPKNFQKGKVLRVEKVSQQELYRTGEYNTLPEKLMKEFNAAKKNGNGNGNGHKTIDQLFDEVVRSA